MTDILNNIPIQHQLAFWTGFCILLILTVFFLGFWLVALHLKARQYDNQTSLDIQQADRELKQNKKRRAAQHFVPARKFKTNYNKRSL